MYRYYNKNLNNKLNDIYYLDNILYDVQRKSKIIDIDNMINYHNFSLNFSEYRNIIKNLVLFKNTNNIKFLNVVISEILSLITKYKKDLNFFRLRGYFFYINNIDMNNDYFEHKNHI